MKPTMMIAVTAVALTSCASHQAAGATPAPPEAGVPLNQLSANGIADTIKRSGMPIPNAHDVTATTCARLQCTGAVDSDPVSIVTFAQSGPAERYAGDTANSYVVEDIVLVFAQATTPADRAAYEHIVEWSAQH
ncbi:hypothetical protein [Mycolicibacterium sp. J2]|uniref:hypothetical protein n=1 Tax=Mycolicibacterium sp. J2 TaxID=2993511 RepID=UPI00224B6BAC|nr:hypothetical protein [Mycolicibacterium sp. J2]MCX2715979.1 hypothetical protein [Mycolicibacterium sp. J2]